MKPITVKRAIAAPVDSVFKAVADVGNLPNVIPDVVHVEFVSDDRSSVGTRFRETRLVDGKENVTELEVTEYVENERVRMVADSHGTVWDSVFTVAPAGEQTELTIQMDARAHQFLPSIMNVVMRGIYKKGVAKHLDAVKAYCEK